MLGKTSWPYFRRDLLHSLKSYYPWHASTRYLRTTLNVVFQIHVFQINKVNYFISFGFFFYNESFYTQSTITINACFLTRFDILIAFNVTIFLTPSPKTRLVDIDVLKKNVLLRAEHQLLYYTECFLFIPTGHTVYVCFFLS